LIERIDMVDRLDALFTHFAVTARMFNTGPLCGINDIDEPEVGHLHVVRAGRVEVRHGGVPAVEVAEPTLLLYPRPLPHRFVTDPVHGATLYCARLRFEGGASNPVTEALPPLIALPLASLEGTEDVLSLLFDEALHERCGRRVMLDRLFEVLLVQVLRCLMERGEMQAGMFAGLAHPKLRLSLVAMHERPAEDWTLDELAQRAGMSRSAFAGAFREVVGETPGGYLQRWRIGLAQRALREGKALKRVADDVGYGSEAALSRAFKAQTGRSPREWRASMREG
jgi:AraC-like DNA-binding protein